MGKWKYINWLVVAIILGFMYRHFLVRYEANSITYILTTVGWLVVAAAGYYVFVYRMRASHGVARPASRRTSHTTITDAVKARPKPKVTLGNRPNDKAKKG